MTMLLGFLALAAASEAQIPWSPPHAIFVNVVNRDLAPVPGATVSIERADGAAGAPVRTATTNVGGHVEFRDLPAGSYLVRVVHAGTLEMAFGPVPIDDKTPPSVRIPQILAMVNPVLSFSASMESAPEPVRPVERIQPFRVTAAMAPRRRAV